MKITIADLEIEEGPTFEPFDVEAPNGKTYNFPHPSEVNGDVLLDIDKMTVPAALAHLLGDNAREFLSQWKLPQLEAIFKQYTAHFGLGTSGNAVASPQS